MEDSIGFNNFEEFYSYNIVYCVFNFVNFFYFISRLKLIFRSFSVLKLELREIYIKELISCRIVSRLKSIST